MLHWVRYHRMLTIGLLITALVVSCAIMAPIVAPDDPYEQNLSGKLRPPGAEGPAGGRHALGTDHLGRDLLSRLIYGIRVSFLVGVLTVSISAAVGVSLGLAAGYFGGAVDNVIMRVTDVLLAIPLVLLAITVIIVFGSGMTTLICVIGFTQWMYYARTVRSETLTVKRLEFVEAARAMGASHLRIVVRAILPNALPSVFVLATLNLATVIMLEAGLSFLGLGIQPPTPSLGNMLAEARQYITSSWWYITFPGIAIMIVVLGINYLGDGLREIVDPRSRLA